MKFRSNFPDIVKKIRSDIRRHHRHLERSATAAVREGSGLLKGDLRQEVISARMGGRLAKTWRSKAYPQGDISMDPAAIVYSKASDIIESFSKNTVIVARNSRFLAIPTKFAPKLAGRKKMTPRNFEKATGLKLVFVDRGPGKNPLLVARGANVSKRGRVRSATVRKATKTMGQRVNLKGLASVPMFVLVPQVRMKKRLDPEKHAARRAAQIPALIDRNMGRGN